jgi:cobalt/nickel transport system permease protein
MAVVLPFVGFYLYRLIAGDAPSNWRRVLSSGIASYVAIVAAAIVAGFEFGIQPYIAHTATGQALYAPYRLGVAVPAMALEHALFFGWVEAIVTMGVVSVLTRSDPALVAMKTAAKPLRWLWAGIGVLIVLTPIGALAPGTAWGEWNGDQLQGLVGYVPINFEKLGSLWKAIMPGYLTPGVSNALLGYLIAAVIGVALCAGIAWGLAVLLGRRHKSSSRGAAGSTTAPPLS